MTNKLQSLRLLGLLEGISYLLLLGLGMPLKYVYEMPMPNYVIGMAHGVLFVGYCLLVLLVGQEKKWNLMTLFWALLASLIPFGTFVADKRIFKPAIENG
ncbi:MAG: DUF3817 domain-containing protein [Bacteroidota bacterium]